MPAYYFKIADMLLGDGKQQHISLHTDAREDAKELRGERRNGGHQYFHANISNLMISHIQYQLYTTHCYCLWRVIMHGDDWFKLREKESRGGTLSTDKNLLLHPLQKAALHFMRVTAPSICTHPFYNLLHLFVPNKQAGKVYFGISFFDFLIIRGPLTAPRQTVFVLVVWK